MKNKFSRTSIKNALNSETATDLAIYAYGCGVGALATVVFLKTRNSLGGPITVQLTKATVDSLIEVGDAAHFKSFMIGMPDLQIVVTP